MSVNVYPQCFIFLNAFGQGCHAIPAVSLSMKQNAWVGDRKQSGYTLEVGVHFIQSIQRILGSISDIAGTMTYPEDEKACEIAVLAPEKSLLCAKPTMSRCFLTDLVEPVEASESSETSMVRTAPFRCRTGEIS